jgi:hypothetical protein
MHLDVEESGNLPEIGQKLRALPTESAVPISFAQFKERQLLRHARLQRSSHRLQFAVAASVSIVMIGAITIWRRVPSPSVSTQRSTAPAMPATYYPVPVAWDEAATRSAASERWLASQPDEPVVVRVGTRAAVTNLEDRIAWIDDTLSAMRANGGEAERARALQYERDRLINSLAQVRFAETLAADLP